MSFRQVSEYVYVRLEDIDKVSAIVADVNDMLEEHPEMGDYLIFRFDSYGEYSLKLYLYAYKSGAITDRKSVVQGKSVSVRVDLGGGRIIQTKKKKVDKK